MRLNGATSARIDNVALTLGPPIAPLVVAEQPDSSPESPADVLRRDLETLLHSSGADITPFLPAGSNA
jgi:hypothetical protein